MLAWLVGLGSQAYRQLGRERDRQTVRHEDRGAEKERNRERARETEKRERERETNL